MDYSFRIRFNRSPTDTIQAEMNELLLPALDSLPQVVVLRARKPDLKICDSDQFAVVSSGYETPFKAEIAGQKVRKALAIALARVRVGADFGERAAKGVFTEHGLKWVEQKIGQRALNNVHGLMIFESLPKPLFASSTGQMIRGAPPDSFITAYAKALETSLAISERDTLSYTLFNASFFQPTADSRFLLLVMAMEALIKPDPRPAESLTLVESLIRQTKQALLPSQEKDSLLGTLRWLRLESINQAGRRMVTERLGNRMYCEMTAPDFFTHCYKIRSKLVHGTLSIPRVEDIGTVAATVEVFVSELLTNPVLGSPQE